jgi:hypothetical protein
MQSREVVEVAEANRGGVKGEKGRRRGEREGGGGGRRAAGGVEVLTKDLFIARRVSSSALP